MVIGKVQNHIAIVKIEIENAERKFTEIDALVDTGFSGSVTLPLSTIIELGLQRRGRGWTELGNGSIEYFDTYSGAVRWNNEVRGIMVEEANTVPLVGMELMEGCDLNIRIIEDGAVTITKIP